jgi:hypothetical protein
MIDGLGAGRWSAVGVLARCRGGRTAWASRDGGGHDNRDLAERFAGRAPIFRTLAEWAESL